MNEVQRVVCQVELPGWGVESRSRSMETCNGSVNQAEEDLTSDEVEGAAVWLAVFLRDETCESLVGHCGRRTQPPLVDRTRGVEVPCSIPRIRCSYALLFSHSCLL